MPARAIVVHRLPGRIRVRIPSKRSDTSFFESVVQKLRPHPGVHELSANPRTGSLLIHHSGEAENILSLAFELFELDDPGKASKRLRAVAKRAGLPLPAILDGTAAVSASLGFYQLARGRDVGPASENFWAAFGSYRFAGSLGLAATFAALGVVQLVRGQVLSSATSLFYHALVAHNLAETERKKDASEAA
jgi:hypothetical protein